MYNAFLEKARFLAESIDAVTLFEVIEQQVDSAALMPEVYRSLCRGGVVTIGTGNTVSWTVRSLGVDWEYFDVKQHGGRVGFFFPKSMRYLEQRSGFVYDSITTRNVRLAETKRTGPVVYRIPKLFVELFNIPSRLLGRGHDMPVVPRKPV